MHLGSVTLREVVQVRSRIVEAGITRMALIAGQMVLTSVLLRRSRRTAGSVRYALLRLSLVATTDGRVALLALCGAGLLLLLIDNLAGVVDVVVFEALTFQILRATLARLIEVQRVRVFRLRFLRPLLLLVLLLLFIFFDLRFILTNLGSTHEALLLVVLLLLLRADVRHGWLTRYFLGQIIRTTSYGISLLGADRARQRTRLRVRTHLLLLEFVESSAPQA